MGALILASALDRSVMQYGTPFLPPCRVRPPPTLAYPNRRHRTRSGPKKDTPLKRELRREREGLRVPRRRERQRRCRFALLTLRCPDRGIRFAPDSPLEEAGFEPLVPRRRPVSSCCRSRSRRLFGWRGCNRHNPISKACVARGPMVRIHLPPAVSQVRTRAGVQSLILIRDYQIDPE
jgi:hypothetical protein